MRRASFVAACPSLLPVVAAGIAWALVTCCARAQANADLDIRFFRLQLCLAGDENVAKLKIGLQNGYNSAAGGYGGGGAYGRRAAASPHLDAPGPPSEYVASLDQDLKACDYASHLKDKDERKGVLDAVHKDIELKSNDCKQFGMGRMVPVRISTMHGTTAASGWSAFYKWSSVSSFPVSELRAPNLTSPATVNLAPGVYAFRAELKAADGTVKKTDIVTLPVAGQQVIEVQIPVP